VHVVPDVIVAPLSAIDPLFATAVTVPLVHVVAAPLGLETIRPVGRESLNATPLSVTEFKLGLPNVNVTVELTFGATVVGENDSPIVGTPITTVTSVPEPALNPPPPEAVTLLVYVPISALDTLTVNVTAG
jgi:hypothetical protein